MTSEAPLRRPRIGEVVTVLGRGGKFEIIEVGGQGTVNLRPLADTSDRDRYDAPWEALAFADTWQGPNDAVPPSQMQGDVIPSGDEPAPRLTSRSHLFALAAVVILVAIALVVLGTHMSIS